MDVFPAQVLAFRLAAQGLAPRSGGAAPAAALAGWAVQDSPPGTAALALAARTDALDPGALDVALHETRSAVALYNPRTATAIVPATDVATFTAGLLPPDEEALRFVLGRAIPPPGGGIGPGEAVATALAAVERALDGRALSRDDLHAELRATLPGELLPWCEGCRSHHARRGLLVAAGLHGRLCIAGRAGRQPLFARTDQWLGPQAAPDAVAPDAAAAEVVRRFLRWSGPATPALFAGWAGIAPAHARRSWALVEDELAEVAVAGHGAAWVLAEDVARLAGAGHGGQAGGSGRDVAGGDAAGEMTGGRPAAALLPPGDPLLLPRDRELLIPDPAARRRLWPTLAAPGLVLLHGAPAATWRGRRRGRRLAVELQPLGAPLDADALAAVEAEAQRIAPHRGCATATVEQAAA